MLTHQDNSHIFMYASGESIKNRSFIPRAMRINDLKQNDLTCTKKLFAASAVQHLRMKLQLHVHRLSKCDEKFGMCRPLHTGPTRRTPSAFSSHLAKYRKISTFSDSTSTSAIPPRLVNPEGNRTRGPPAVAANPQNDLLVFWTKSLSPSRRLCYIDRKLLALPITGK